VREEFHASKPLRLEFKSAAESADFAWLRYELNQLLTRGKMHIAPVATDPVSDPKVFTLQVTMSPDGKQAALALVAPDNIVDRKTALPLPNESRLEMIRTFATALPRFLNAAHATGDWVALLGTDDSKAYDTFLDGALEWSSADSPGFTQPGSARRSPAVERLETLIRQQPKFARAWGTLAIGYLSLGGEDETSLTQLAESKAERALTLDDNVAEAHAALGLVHLRRNEWVAAREQFARALTLNAHTGAALEGLACLLVDAGRYREAAPFAAQAVALQPGNHGARDCFAYTLTQTKAPAGITPRPSPVQALEALLGGDNAAGREILRSSVGAQDFSRWAEPLLQAAENRRYIPQALQAVTLAASEKQIDPTTEILCGAALKQPEFVFNRMSRLQRQGERLPLRVLWMPQTQFLRQHARFEQIVSTAGLPAFWQEQGLPDVCGEEPKLYGCQLQPAPIRPDRARR
jgi:tetratricopeptide (TPR) repeat protein